MSDADVLNRTLERTAPAVWRCLSPLGRQAAFPKGIPFQSGQAKGTQINATIGQLTDGAGAPLPLPMMQDAVTALDTRKTFLYSPVEGHADVADAWRARQQRIASTQLPVSRPIATHGLTNGLSLLANLFGAPDMPLILPTPFWGNYRLIFTMHAHMPITGFPFFADGGFNIDGLAQTLGQLDGKAMLVLNLPGNPTGYALRPDEARRLTEVIAAHPHPLVIVVDDAYQGFVYEPDRLVRSVFWELAEALDPERHALFKVDGATKELLFFPSRLGYITHPFVDPDAEAALLSKIKYLLRGTVGSPPGPSEALVWRALQDPGLDAAFAERVARMGRRYQALKDALARIDSDRIVPYPFNAAFFMMMELRGVDADEVRLRLIEEESCGTIAMAAPNALRVAHCSVREADIPTLIEKIARVVG